MRGRSALGAALGIAALSAACGSSGSAVAPQGQQAQFAAEELLSVSMTPDETVITDEDDDSVVMIEVAASPRPAGPRPPVAMAIVLDASGSMEGASWEHAERAAHAMVDQLGAGDGVAIVSYADSAYVVYQSFAIDDTAREQAHEAIEAMEPLGNTCISCGLETGYAALQSAYSGQLRRVVLMSDGRANRGYTDQETLLAIAAQAHSYWGIDTSTIGLGRLHDSMLMAALAESGSSYYYYLSDAAQLAAVLERELSDLQTTVLTGLQLYLIPGDGVTIAGTPNSGAYMSGTDLVFDLGQLAVGERRQLVVALALPPGDVGRVLTARATFADPTGFTYGLESAARVRRSTDPAEVENSREPRVREQLSLMQSMSNAQQVLRALQQAQSTDGVGVLREAAAGLRQNATLYGSTMLADEAVRMDELADSIELELDEEPAEAPESGVEDFARSEELLRGIPAAEAYHH